MLIKLLFMLIYYYFMNFSYDKKAINNTNIKEKNFLNIAKPQLLENNKTKDIMFTISIKEINLINKPIYNINSSENNVNKNITILKGTDSNTIFLAAHSGTGYLAYFKNLHKLKKNSEILLYYNNMYYTYIVTDMYVVNKTGSIRIPRSNNKQLILTTCGEKNNTQLIVISKLK